MSELGSDHEGSEWSSDKDSDGAKAVDDMDEHDTLVRLELRPSEGIECACSSEGSKRKDVVDVLDREGDTFNVEECELEEEEEELDTGKEANDDAARFDRNLEEGRSDS